MELLGLNREVMEYLYQVAEEKGEKISDLMREAFVPKHKCDTQVKDETTNDKSGDDDDDTKDETKPSASVPKPLKSIFKQVAVTTRKSNSPTFKSKSVIMSEDCKSPAPTSKTVRMSDNTKTSSKEIRGYKKAVRNLKKKQMFPRQRALGGELNEETDVPEATRSE